MAMIPTRFEYDIDEVLLQKRESSWENDEHKITAVEYCLKDCEGNAHKTGVAQGDGSFCELHVHRSVDMAVKRWPVQAGAVAASLT